MPVPDNRSVLSSMLQMRPLINLVAQMYGPIKSTVSYIKGFVGSEERMDFENVTLISIITLSSFCLNVI